MDFIFFPATKGAGSLKFPFVFGPRFWENREHWKPPGVGTVPGSEKAFPALRIPVPPRNIEGTPDQWLNGFLYSDYIAGRLPSGTCIPVAVSCPNIDGDPPATVYVEATGWGSSAFGDYTAMNGDTACQTDGPCQWDSPTFSSPSAPTTWQWRVVAGFGQITATLTAATLGTGAVYQLSEGWNGRDDVILPLLTSGLPSATTPASVMLSITAGGDKDVIPPGMIQPYLGTTPPPGWVFADGAAYPVTAPYANLYALIGHDYDTDRGQTAPASGFFRVPLLNGLVIGAAGPAVAASPPSPATNTNAPGDFKGEEEAPIVTGQMPPHVHGVTDPGHTHSITDPTHTHTIFDVGHTHTLVDGHRPVSDDNSGLTYENGVPTTGGITDIAGATTGIVINSASTGITGANSNTTGITTTDAAGSGNPIDRKQPTRYYHVCIKL